MRRPTRSCQAALILIALLWLLTSCSNSTRSRTNNPPPVNDDKPAWESIDAGRYRVKFTPLATLRNTGLQLPLASPDGRWVAALSCPNTLALDPDAALTGHTISDVTLLLYSTTSPQTPPRVVATGAAWPVWTPDSKQLLAVAYDRSNHCGLIIHQLSTGQTLRQEIGLSHIITPAISPDGKQLALAGFTETPEQAHLYLYQLESRRLTALPPPKDALWQINPIWVTEKALLYYGRIASDTGLLGATADGSKPSLWLAKIALPLLAADALRSQAAITHPLSPDTHWLALFDAPANRIILHQLDDLRSWPLESNCQAGCWAGLTPNPRFLYATDKQLLVAAPATDSRVLAASPFLPLWSQPNGRTFLLLAPGHEDWTFQLVSMQIAPAP